MSGLAYTPATGNASGVSQADFDALAARIQEQERMTNERDTDGNVVPVWKGRTYNVDDSGNPMTETVTDGPASWVKTYTYDNGRQIGDSGWVRQ